MLSYSTTAQTVHATNWHPQLNTLIEQVAIAHSANPSIMDERAGLVTSTTLRCCIWARLQMNDQGVLIGCIGDGRLKAWPEGVEQNRMHGDGRVEGLVCLATTNLPSSLSVYRFFPTIPRRTKEKARMGLF